MECRSDEIMKEYNRWLKNADMDLRKELKQISGDEALTEDAFYRNLEFGTGGLRGVIGAGTNRMNIHTVSKASQGLADYLKNHGKDGDHLKPGIQRMAISYDSRINSERFAQIAAGVFAANGLEVFIYSELMPAPCLSFAVRELHCAAGVMVTASHNPAIYNGYKVYGPDGCQITTEAASEIQKEIDKLDLFHDIRTMEYDRGIKTGQIQYISDAVFSAFIEEVKKQSMLYDGTEIDKKWPVTYSPLNGTGRKPVLHLLKESGYTNIAVVKEQERPDGNFPTCPYPNPERKEAMKLGIEYAMKNHSELFLATDPDCDRVGIAVRNTEGAYVTLSGNETGLLLLNYICSRRKEMGRMPDEPVMVKTIVTTDLSERIAAYYGVSTINVLTGFKYIGEQIGKLETSGRADSYIFGFEESYGYLSGSYVRDKDAVGGVYLICEMFTYYRSRGVSLLHMLDEIYSQFGFCLNTLHTYEFEGPAGIEKMRKIMNRFRKGFSSVGTKRVLHCKDYAAGLDGLPESDVLKFFMEDDCSVVARPSGTEPKLKIYVSVNAGRREEASRIEQEIVRDLECIVI